VVGVKCCDTSPFSIGWSSSPLLGRAGDANLTWGPPTPNTTTVSGLKVSMQAAAPIAGPAAAAGMTAVGLRLNWEPYPNCAVYNAAGGPRAGAWNVKGAVAKGCVGYSECVYEGTALPALPAQVPITADGGQ